MCNSVGDVKAPLQLLFIVSQEMSSKGVPIDYASAKTFVVRMYNVTNNNCFWLVGVGLLEHKGGRKVGKVMAAPLQSTPLFRAFSLFPRLFWLACPCTS